VAIYLDNEEANVAGYIRSDCESTLTTIVRAMKCGV